MIRRGGGILPLFRPTNHRELLFFKLFSFRSTFEIACSRTNYRYDVSPPQPVLRNTLDTPPKSIVKQRRALDPRLYRSTLQQITASVQPRIFFDSSVKLIFLPLPLDPLCQLHRFLLSELGRDEKGEKTPLEEGEGGQEGGAQKSSTRALAPLEHSRALPSTTEPAIDKVQISWTNVVSIPQ